MIGRPGGCGPALPPLEVLVLSWLLPLLLASPALAGDEAPRPTLELLPAWSHATPGAELELGLHFDLPEGWHIYWTNPGDSGLPTEATFTGPEGTTFGPLRYPAPERFEAAGPIVNYGYAGQTALLTTATVPRELGGRFRVEASATWLLCRELCVYQQGTATASIPVARTPRQQRRSAPAHADRLAKPRSRVPAPLVDAIARRRSRTVDGWRLEVILDGQLPASVVPDAGLDLLLDAHAVRWEEGAVVVQLDGRFGEEDSEVAAVLSLKQHGGTRWYRVSIPVSPQAWSDAAALPPGEPE